MMPSETEKSAKESTGTSAMTMTNKESKAVSEALVAEAWLSRHDDYISGSWIDAIRRACPKPIQPEKPPTLPDGYEHVSWPEQRKGVHPEYVLLRDGTIKQVPVETMCAFYIVRKSTPPADKTVAVELTREQAEHIDQLITFQDLRIPVSVACRQAIRFALADKGQTT